MFRFKSLRTAMLIITLPIITILLIIIGILEVNSKEKQLYQSALELQKQVAIDTIDIIEEIIIGRMENLKRFATPYQGKNKIDIEKINLEIAQMYKYIPDSNSRSFFI